MSDFRDYAGVDFSSQFLAHYGVGHDKGGNSGRYKWGSGDRPYQRTSMEGQGSKKEAKQYKRQLNKLERKRSIARVSKKTEDAERINRQIEDTILELKSKGYTVNSKEYKDYVDKGEILVGYLLAGPIGAVIATQMFSDKHSVKANRYKVTDPETARNNELKEKEKKLYEEYSEANDRLMRTSKDDPRYNTLYNDMKAKEKAANDTMIERAMAKDPTASVDKIAKSIGFPKNVVQEYKRNKELDESIKELNEGSKSDKAWAKVLEIDRNKNSYETQEEYDRARRKAANSYETVRKQERAEYEKSLSGVKMTDAQKERYNKAKTKDLWDMEFLEMYQPEEWDSTKALKEYELFLKDEDQWIQKHGRF